MRIDVVTLFPELFEIPMQVSLLGKARENGLLEVAMTNPRDFADDPHRTVDDAPYGGGPGMVMKYGPIKSAIDSLRERNSLERVILLSPRGNPLTQKKVIELSQATDMVLICGRYEGVDERISQSICTEEISMGDYVLSGGEIPALALIESVSRMLPGVIGDFESVETDSFYKGILGPPQYTRPPEIDGAAVPEVLRNGNHAAIERFRRKESLRVTKERRPELLTDCTPEDKALLKEIETETRDS